MELIQVMEDYCLTEFIDISILDIHHILDFLQMEKWWKLNQLAIRIKSLAWLNNEFEANGFYTIQNDVINFTITSPSGRVSYSGRILKEALDIDVTSHINGYSASNLRYDFCCLT